MVYMRILHLLLYHTLHRPFDYFLLKTLWEPGCVRGESLSLSCRVGDLAQFEVLTGPAADEILELHSVRFMVFAGSASDRIFVLQMARFVVLTGPAADEILEIHFIRLMVFAGPASDSFFVLQIARFVVLTGPAADESLASFVRRMVFVGPASNAFSC